MHAEARALRRRKQRGVAAALREDLYKRDDRGNPDPERCAQWISPGGLKVRYGAPDTDDGTLWIECVGADWKVYARTDDGDERWLDAEMF